MILETLTCVVQRITYRSHESGYAVIKVTVHGYRRLVPMIGELLEVQLASSIIVQGSWKMDPLYGRQFEVHKWKEVLPADLNKQSGKIHWKRSNQRDWFGYGKTVCI